MADSKYEKTGTSLFRLLTIFIAAVFFIPPFFQGLFYDYQMLAAQIVIAAVFSIFYYRDTSMHDSFFKSWFDYAAVALILSYMISITVAVNYRLAVGEVLRLLSYFAVYYMIAYGIKEKTEVKLLLRVFAVAGLLVALLGFVSAYDNVQLLKSIVYAGRLSSTLQYPNTLAVYLTAAMLVTVGLTALRQPSNIRCLYYGANYVIISCIIGTQSRGNFVVFPVALALLFVCLPKGSRLKPMIHTFVVLVIALLFSGKTLAYVQDQAHHGLWLWLGMGTILSIGAGFLVEKAVSLPQVLSSKEIKIAVAVAGSILIVAGLFYVNSRSVITTQAFKRITEISKTEQGASERIAFYKDALKIVKDYPLFGTGGGGWSVIYKKYQGHFYNTTQVHNYYLQTWVEGGSPALLALVALWVIFMGSFFKTYFKLPDDRRILSVSTAVPALAIGIHSLLDFNMAFGGISLLLWGFFGLNAAVNPVDNKAGDVIKKSQKSQSKLGYRRIVVGLLIAVFVLISGDLAIGLHYGTKGSNAFNNGDYSGSLDELKLASKFDPLTADYQYAMACIMFKQAGQQNDVRFLQISNAYINRAIILNSGNFFYRFKRAEIYMNLGEFDKAVEEVRTAVSLAPMEQEPYMVLAKIHFLLGSRFDAEGKPQLALYHFKKALEVPEMMERVIMSLSPERKRLWLVHGPLLKVTPEMEQYFNVSKETAAILS